MVGILGWAYALFGPAYRYLGNTISSDGKAIPVSGATSVAQRGLEPAGIVIFAVVVLVVVSLAAGAYCHSRRGTRAVLMLL